MSGPLGSAQWMYASGAEVTQQSLKFNDDETQYLSWTPASAGNRRTWTWSGWVKRGSNFLGTNQSFFSTATASDDLRFSSNETILFYGGAGLFNIQTRAKYRDVSAWYHIVVAYDSTQATSTDRIKIYVNGQQETDLVSSTYPTLDREVGFNNSVAHAIGRSQSASSSYFDGYMSDIHFIDGQALDPTSFGETVDGYWKAKDYAGTYGTNGFRLTFQDDVVSEGFNAVTYTGTGATQSISGLGFQNDLLWIKSRTDSAGTHRLIDSVRGGSLALQSDGNGIELDNSAQVPSPRDADGFTVAGNTSAFNQSGDTYVAWCWDAGTGSATLNQDGSIDSTVKANPNYGFSIVSWVGDGVNQGATVGHSLGVTPSMFIVKSTDSSASWNVWHKDLTNATTSRVLLDNNSDEFDSVYVWGSTAPDNLTFGVGTVGTTTWTNRLNRNYIAYCFAEVSGYSSFGSYTGTAATQTVTTGFRPALVVVKNIDDDTFGNWHVFDNTRNVPDFQENRLEWDTPDVEAVASGFFLGNFTDTGFEITNSSSHINQTGSTFIYMAFADTREAAFWKDVSGQGNHWTPNNLDYRDSLLDSPANNFAVLNPLYRSTSTSYPTPALSEGNLAASTSSGSNWKTVPTTMYMSTGKWYAEVKVTYTDAVDSFIGFASEEFNGQAYTPSNTAFGYQFHPSLGIRHNSTQLSAQTFTQGDIIGLALNMDDNEIKFYKNGSLLYTATSVAAGSWSVSLTLLYTKTLYANFGQDSTFAGNETAGGNTDANGIGDFKYAPPAGYLALCTANLPTPTIVDGSEHFNTVLYTGDGVAIGSGGNTITGAGHQPDFVWIKARNQGYSSHLYDTVRGATEGLVSNETLAESTRSEGLTSFDADGFTVGSQLGENQLNTTFAAWNWKAGGAASSIAVDAYSSGVPSIASSVSANTDAGFSIVSFTCGSGVTSGTVGHGLGVQPQLIIGKTRNHNVSWYVHTPLLAANLSAILDSSAGWYNPGYNHWNDTHPTDTVFSVGGYMAGHADLTSPSTKICYCFANVEGYQKVGTYVGNGVSDGPMVFTNFRPSFVLTKRSDSTSWWGISDSARSPFNEVANTLAANETYNEATLTSDLNVDFLSNGFKIRDTSSYYNATGITYIYLAIAETPFKFSLAR